MLHRRLVFEEGCDQAPVDGGRGAGIEILSLVFLNIGMSPPSKPLAGVKCDLTMTWLFAGSARVSQSVIE